MLTPVYYTPVVMTPGWEDPPLTYAPPNTAFGSFVHGHFEEGMYVDDHWDELRDILGDPEVLLLE